MQTIQCGICSSVIKVQDLWKHMAATHDWKVLNSEQLLATMRRPQKSEKQTKKVKASSMPFNVVWGSKEELLVWARSQPMPEDPNNLYRSILDKPVDAIRTEQNRLLTEVITSDDVNKIGLLSKRLILFAKALVTRQKQLKKTKSTQTKATSTSAAKKSKGKKVGLCFLNRANTQSSPLLFTY